MIRKRFSELNCISSALSIYDALCELASDAQSNSFEMATPTIAKTAGVGTRTAQSILPKLEVFGFIDIAKRKFPGTNMDAPSIYTLCKVGGESNHRTNGCAPLSNGCAPLRNDGKQSSLRTSEESLKESSEESRKSFSTTSSPLTPQPQAVGGMEQGKGALTPEEIWDRTCRVLGRSLEKPISRPEKDVLLGCASWLIEADLQVLEAEERHLSAFPNRRSQTAYSFLCHAATRLVRLRGRAAKQAVSQPLAQPASPTQAKRPTVDEVFAYISPNGWDREAAVAYIRKRTRADPPWHLPATHDRPARLIGADWRVDVNCFLNNWNRAEAKSAKERDDDIPF